MSSKRNKTTIVALDPPTVTLLTSLKSLRASAGLTKTALAQQLNITDGSIAAYEKRKVAPKLGVLIRLADFFSYDLSESVNYKYYYRMIDPPALKDRIKRLRLDYYDIAELTGYSKRMILCSVNLNGASLPCLYAIFRALEQAEREADYD